MPSKGRIRLNREQADYLLETLHSDRHRTVVRRAAARDGGADKDEMYGWNRKIELIDDIEGEVVRTITEMGWINGRPAHSA